MNILYYRLLALGQPFRCGGGGGGGGGDGGDATDAAVTAIATGSESDAAAAITGMCSAIGADAVAIASEISNSADADTPEGQAALAALGEVAAVADACVATVAAIAVSDPGSLGSIAQGIADGINSSVAAIGASLGNPSSTDSDNSGVVATLGNPTSDPDGGFNGLVGPLQGISNQPFSSIGTQRGDQSGSVDGASATQFWGYTANQTYAARAAQGLTTTRQEATDIARDALITQRTNFSINTSADITAQIRGELGSGPQNQGYLNLILNKYSAEDLARAYPEFGNAADYQAAKDGLPKDLIVPGSLDAEGRQQLVQGTPEFIRAEQLTRQGAREAIRKAAIANGFPPDAAIPTTGDINGRVYITLENGKLIDITDYFEGVPKSPVAIDIGVPTYGTSTVASPFREVEITSLPTSSIVVNTSQGAITVDPNSEVARQIQWRGSQPDPVTGRPIRESWARAGIGDPYSNPAIVAQAVEAIDRADSRTSLFNQSGVNPPASQIAPWNDPKWPEYQGSNKEAYESASRALTDVNYQQQLKAENGWDQATFDSWALRATNPEEWGRQAAAASAAAGLVVGPTSSTTTGLSANGTTAVTTTGQVNSQGFALSTYSTVNNAAGAVDAATGGLITTGAGAINTATNVVGTATAVATAALAGYASASAALSTAEGLINSAIKSPSQLPDSLSPFVQAATGAFQAAASTGLTTVENLFSGQAATLLLAKNQATLQARYNQAATADWRVRLQLAPNADYLYKDAEPGILAPLFDTDGVLFPYMPSIETSYAANYDKFDLTHSNYRGYFYKGSNVNDINIRATFTAQDTQEANYMLAVIHFFRSVTKMFYGQDSYRGAPPPLVFLSGLGDYQFSNHPCFVASFNYSLPNDVDYIRALAPNNYGNLFSQRSRTGSTSGGVLGSVATRLFSAGLDTVNPSQPNVPAPNYINNNVNNLDNATYVPTKMEINFSLLPTNTRAQVSQQFSLKGFANGNLLKGGFW